MRIATTNKFLAAIVFSALLAGCGGSDGSGDPVVAPGPGTGSTPNQFSFTDQTDVAPSTEITSAPVSITGIDTPAPVTVTGGSYSVGCTATYVTTAGTISNDEIVCLRHTSADSASTTTDTTLTVGGVSVTFTSTTAAPGASDTTPEAFEFVDQHDMVPSTEITSDPVTITGIDVSSPVTVENGSYSVGCTATYVTTAGTISNSQTVCVRHTSADSASTATATTLTVGGVSATFTSTTAAPGASNTTPSAFNFVDQFDVVPSTEITSGPVTITGIDVSSPVTVENGSYSVGCTATYVTTAGTISNDQTVCVRHTSADSASTATETTLTVGGVSATFSSTTAAPEAADTTPDAFNFVDQDDVATSTQITSDPVTITGINEPAPVTVTGGSYSVGCTATYVTTAGTISNDQTVCLRHISADSASTATDTTLTVGGVSDTFTSTTKAPADTTPNAFDFGDQFDVVTSTQITSPAVRITGINEPAPVTVRGGSYSVGCTATYVTTAGTISNNQSVCVRHTSAATNGTATNTILTVGDVSGTFTSTTKAPDGTRPNGFNFVDQFDVATSTLITSAAVTITGFNEPAPVTVRGGSYSIGCTATYVTTAGTISNNQTVCVRHTSAASAGTATNTTLTVGGVSDTFTSTTAAPGGSDTTPNSFNFVDQDDVETSTEITSDPVTITGINEPAPVSVTGGSYSVGCTATFETTAGTISNNQTVCVRHTSADSASAATNTTLTVGGVSDTFTSTTAAPGGSDTTPDAFNFVDQDDVETSTEITSDPVTVTGINAPAPVSVTGGSYSVGCTATFETTAGTISNDETVCVRHTSATTGGTATDTTLTVGGVSDTFTSTTQASADTTPDAFNFVDQDDVETSTEITSDPVTITGIDEPAPVSVTGGSYSVGCTATFVTTAGTISNDETVCARHTSAASADTTTDTTLTVGGVSDTFTSTTTTATVATSKLLPFLTGGGELRLYDPEAPIALPNTNPRTVDTGLTPPAPSNCTAELLVDDCFGKAKTFYSGTASGSTVTGLQGARLAYINGGEVYRVNLTQSIDSSQVEPVRISSLADACRIVESETTDFGNIDSSAVVVERPGPDGQCGEKNQFPSDPALDDNSVTVIRLNSSAVDAGLDLPLVLTAGNPLHAQTDASAVITGYVSFEGSGADLRLVRRDADLANPTTLMELGQTGGARIERADLTHLFVTAIPDGDGLTLFRVESDGSLSPSLHFFGFVSGNLIRDGLHDADHLYFSHANRLLRIPLDSAGELAQPATVLTELDPALRIEGNWALDTGATPDRVVFEALDDGFTVLSGVFSVPSTASGVTATTLANSPDSEGGSATLLLASHGRAYINITHHGAPGEDALKINSDGTGEVLFAGQPDGSGAYWAGSHRATSFDRGTDFSVPTRHIVLARHGSDLNDTLSVFDPATGLEGVELGTVESPGDFQAVRVSGTGRYALARVEIDRFGARDSNVYALDAETTGSLTPLAETEGATDMPIGN